MSRSRAHRRGRVWPLLRSGCTAFGLGRFGQTRCGGVGSAGRVWAVEPGDEAAAFLARSIALNGFAHVELMHCALSGFDGRGFLEKDVKPELRRLVRDKSAGAVQVRRLDSLAAERGIAGGNDIRQGNLVFNIKICID